MNNDLEQFGEKRLRLLTDYSGTNAELQWGEIEALARIALAAKQAKPVGYATRDENYDWHIDFCGETHCLSQGDSLYTTPQPAHTEHDGWIKCSERMPDDWQLVAIINAGHGEIYEAATVTRSGPHFILMDGLEASNYDGGAVVTLSMEATHWMPLPAAPKPESE